MLSFAVSASVSRYQPIKRLSQHITRREFSQTDRNMRRDGQLSDRQAEILRPDPELFFKHGAGWWLSGALWLGKVLGVCVCVCEKQRESHTERDFFHVPQILTIKKPCKIYNKWPFQKTPPHSLPPSPVKMHVCKTFISGWGDVSALGLLFADPG